MFRVVAVTAMVATTLWGSGGVVAAPAEPLTVRFIAPVDGEVVSGVVPLEAETTGPASSVAFEWSGDGGGQWHPLGTDADPAGGWTWQWNSSPYSGPALLRATAADGSATETAQVAVTVDNSPPTLSVGARPQVFSPNRDGRRDRAIIRFSVSEAASVRIRIRREAGGTVREWTTATSGPARGRIEWTGRAGGSPVPDGRYRVEAQAVDAVGLRGSSTAAVVVDTTAPATSWRRIAPDPLEDQRRMTFSFRARDRSPRVRVKLLIVDAAGRRMGTVRRTVDSGRSRVTWTPRRPGGGPLYPGLYRALLRVRDDAGNDSLRRARVFRVHRSAPARVFTRLADAGRRVALTFDDCHVRAAWSKILDVLRRQRVRATFFCPGQMVRWNPDLARRTVRGGHTAASHAWDHAYLPGRGVDATASRLRADAKAWWEVAKVTSAPYFRPPYGAYDRAVLTGAGQAFHPRVMLWDVDTNDWQRPGSSTIAARAVRGSRPGSVVLMHTLDQTAAALPAIINGLRARGLEPVSLPVLFRAARQP